MTEPRRDRAYLTEDEVEQSAELTDTEEYEAEQPRPDTMELLTESDLRDGETSDPNVAAEEGLTWVPPIDPPVVADAESPDGVTIAAGFGTDAFEEPYDADHKSEPLSALDDLEARIHEALRADSSTSRYADSLVIGNRGGTVVVRGLVDDIDDTDDIADVISRVEGVEEVVDETEVAGVTD